MKSLFLSFILLCVSVCFGQTIVSVTPDAGNAGDTVPVTITGSGTNFGSNTRFVFSQGTSLLQVDNIVVQNTTSATCDIVIPASATSGFYTLTAVTGLSIPVIKQNAFEVMGGAAAASIVSIEPNSARQKQSVSVMVTCSGTVFLEATTIAVSLLTTSGTPIVADIADAMDDSSLFCFFTIPEDATLGSYSFVITTDNSILTQTDGFTIMEAMDPGALASITPNESSKDTTITVLIEGEGTSFLSMNNLMTYLYSDASGFFPAISIEVLSDNLIEATFEITANARIGLYSLVVSSDMDFLFLEDAFTITGDPTSEPRLVSISPASGFPGQTVSMLVTGANTHFLADELDINAVIFNQDTFVETSLYTVFNDSVINVEFELPNSLPLGVYDFGLLTRADGVLTLAQSFFVNAVGIAEQVKRLNRVYPNPVKEILSFETDQAVRKVALMNMEGKLVELTDVSKNNNVYSVIMNREHFHSGVYFLRVETSQGVLFQKIIME